MIDNIRESFLKVVFTVILTLGVMLYNASAQSGVIRGKVMNDFTKEAVAFAGISWKKAGFGVLSDSAGAFILRKSDVKNDTLVLHYVGFAPQYRSKQSLVGDTITLYLKETKENDGVVVKSKFSKGLRWWRQIVAHKAVNNPYRFANYSYELYNKLELDLTKINKKYFDKPFLKPFAFLLKNIDSTTDVVPFLPVFVTEALSDCYQSHQPEKMREYIKAVQTNGIKNETVLQFLGGVTQKVNVYSDYMMLFSKEFISPLSANGDKFYYYKGADTQTINNEKYFHLLFKPLQDGSNTFTGDCWIHAKTWAIYKINLTASPSANINFVNRLSVVQEFAKMNDTLWMFAKDKIIADLSPFKKEAISCIGRKTATYKNIQLNLAATDSLLATNSQATEVTVAEGAHNVGSNYWNNVRHEPLSVNELKVYHMIDTLRQMPLFKAYSNAITFITDGRKKFGKIEIGPWYKWISGNQLEKLRLRFDIGTTTAFSEKLRLNAYVAYGFHDARWKCKAAYKYNFGGNKGWYTYGAYTHDLDNGRIRYDEDADASVDNLFSQLIRRQHIRQKFLGIEETKMALGKSWRSGMSADVVLTHTAYETFQPLPAKDQFSYRADGSIQNSEIAFKWRYAPGERKIVTHRKTIRIKSDKPVWDLKIAHSLKGIWNADFAYTKASTMLSQKTRIPGWGSIDYLVYGGKIWGNKLPFMLLEIHPGNEIYYYNKQSFNLMNRFEYISDSYVGVNIEHNFEKKLLNLVPLFRKTKIRQFWNVKTVWGNLNAANRKFNKLDAEFASYRLKSLHNKFYTEVGTGIDNLFKFFRIDAVWRFAPTSRSINNQPFYPSQQFGIFGSFRLQF